MPPCPMTPPRSIVKDLLDVHAGKAAQSEYDRTVSITAISAARKTIADVSASLPDGLYAALVLEKLRDLASGYHDPDGEYTSGKGVLGDLLGDLEAALNKISARSSQ